MYSVIAPIRDLTLPEIKCSRFFLYYLFLRAHFNQSLRRGAFRSGRKIAKVTSKLSAA